MAEAEQEGWLPVCIFGNGTRIELKEDDAHWVSRVGSPLTGSHGL